MSGLFVSYVRVSTVQQGASGLGLEAQRLAVADFLATTNGELVGEYEEVESGKRADRPALAEAMDHCRLTGARLLIAKLDRLSRNVAFLTDLMEKGVEFVACDMPNATEFTVHIMIAVAQQEGKAISARTKAALGSIKARLAAGEEYVSRRSSKPVTRLGNPKGLTVSRRDLGSAAVARKADVFAAAVRPRIAALRAEGLSLASIAARLTERRVLTPRRGAWTAMAVKRVLERADR